jgi:hypothetical protein
MPRDVLIKRFKTRILNNWSTLNEPSKAGGRVSCIYFYRLCLTLLNGKTSKKTFFRQKDPSKEVETPEEAKVDMSDAL